MILASVVGGILGYIAARYSGLGQRLGEGLGSWLYRTVEKTRVGRLLNDWLYRVVVDSEE